MQGNASPVGRLRTTQPGQTRAVRNRWGGRAIQQAHPTVAAGNFPRMAERVLDDDDDYKTYGLVPRSDEPPRTAVPMPGC